MFCNGPFCCKTPLLIDEKNLAKKMSNFINDSGLDGNKLVQAWNIARHFYLSYFSRVVKSTLGRFVLDVR